MACETVPFEVNGHKYHTTQWPPTKALPLLGKVTKYVIPVITPLMKMMPDKLPAEGEIPNIELSDEAMAEIIVALSNLEPEILSGLLFELIQGVASVDKGIRIEDVDAFFSDYPQDMFGVAFQCAKAQFMRFLPAGSLKSFLKAKEESPSLKGQPLTGTSGDQSQPDIAS